MNLRGPLLTTTQAVACRVKSDRPGHCRTWNGFENESEDYFTQRVKHAPLNGMPHLAYILLCPDYYFLLSAFSIRIFPEGLVHSEDRPSQNYAIHILSHCVKCLGRILCEFHIYLSHTVHDREIWGICCKRYVRRWQAGLYPACCSIRTCQFPSYPPIKPQILEVGHSTDTCRRITLLSCGPNLVITCCTYVHSLVHRLLSSASGKGRSYMQLE